jgi:hypothetical protein
MSKSMDEVERQAGLYCTPSHVVKALLKREQFVGTIWDPAAGKGHIVRVLTQCGYPDVIASDIKDWGFELHMIQDFLASTRRADSIVMNPPFDKKAKFLVQAKRLVRHKIAMLVPLDFECTMGFRRHELDLDFPWKAIYSFPQAIRWANVNRTWGKIKHAWFVFERGYEGPVLRNKIVFERNKG